MDDLPVRYVLGVAIGVIAGLTLSVFVVGVSASFPVFLVRSLATVGLTIAVAVTLVARLPRRR